MCYGTILIEKMASDDNYAADQMHKVDTAVKMSRRINELFGFEQNWGNGDDTIQPSHPLSSPSPPVFNLSQHQSLFK